MTRVLAFVEGPTEEKFIKKSVAPALGDRNVSIVATTPGRKRTQGGVQSWTRARKDLLRYLREDTGRVVTTMFDYYGMPTDWPGRDMARSQTHHQRAATVENALLDDISLAMGDSFNRYRFIPYVQMYEFEALLFSDPDTLGKVFPEQNFTQTLQDIARQFPTPEEINDDPNTAPSKRILRLSRQYQKVLHGNIAAQQTGLARIREKCPHFNAWLIQLENLGTT